MSNTSKFVKVFDPTSETHVKWLSHMCDIAETLSPEKPTILMTEINKNPLNIKLDTMDVLDWPHIHFCLCAVYAKAVLRGKAWLPTSQTPSLKFSS
jgi:hypothetical protein